MYTEFIEFCKNQHPEYREIFEKESLSPNLFSFKTVPVSKNAFAKVQEFIQAAYHLRNNLNYQKDVLGHETRFPNKSVLMSFDFHINGDTAKLIEINTNASHFLTSKLMESFVCKAEKRDSPFPNAIGKLKDSFFNEWKLFSNQVLKNICIVDEEPENQKAYFEFLLYKKLFEADGFQVSIEDYKDLKWKDSALFNTQDQKIDLVYNRSTDFYFEDQKSQSLKQAYNQKAACISPQPEEYKLFADKQRLMDFSTPGFLEKYLLESEIKIFKDVILEIINLTKENKDTVWANRKRYFFKPTNSYGGKGAYKGESITHKTFDQAVEAGDYIAQEFAPPSTTTITDQVSHNVEAKCDFRFYVYDGEIQFAIARTYVGQTTNFRTLGGGFAAVSII